LILIYIYHDIMHINICRETEHMFDDESIGLRSLSTPSGTLLHCAELDEQGISNLQKDFNQLVYNMICVLLEEPV